MTALLPTLSDGQLVGVVILLAMVALLAYEYVVASLNPPHDSPVEQAAAVLLAEEGRRHG